MRLFLLTALVMTAFAGNSVLNRMALLDGRMDAVAFGAIRLVAGAVALAALVLVSRRSLPLLSPRRLIEAPALALYVFGFSLAYRKLDAGTGALILFGGVQVVMFAGALASRPPPRRWIGAAVAICGLALLAAGGTGGTGAMVLMAAAAAGWGVYSLSGRRSGDPLSDTAANFGLAALAALVGVPLLPQGEAALSGGGIALAVLSGAVTSGLGYALWYTVLPRLPAEAAGLAQLSVPVIAILAGAVLLGEAPPLRTVAACAVILGGVALGLAPARRRVTAAA